MSTGALIFLLVAWAVVISLVVWSYYRLLKGDSSHEPLPPPGSIP